MIPIGEVDFGDFETQGLYKIAAEFPDSVTANLFLQIYRDSGVDVPEFLQVYLNEYVKDLQGQADDPGDADAQEDAPDSLPELPFDVQDVAPPGTLNFSEESLEAINTLFEQEGIPPPEGLESMHPDENVALSDESDIMESPDAQEEDGNGENNTSDPNRQTTEGTGEFERYVNEAYEVDVSTGANQAVFYSGKGNRALAEAFAKLNGKMTLEMTPGGRYFDNLDLFGKNSPLTEEQALKVWEILSKRYAKSASGNVYGIVKGANPGSIFNTVEYQALKENPYVTNIFTELFD